MKVIDLAQADRASGGPLLEIACDESGYEGEKLIGATTDVFAHASVRLDTRSAADCMHELRRRIRSPALEYKANHLLREKSRPVLEWLLGPSGPLHGHAQVYLVDKEFLVVGTVVAVLVEGATHTAQVGLSADRHATMAVTLWREGRRTFAREQWDAFLVSSNNLMRTKDRLDPTASIDSFFRAIDVLRVAGAPDRVDEILRLLRRARPHAESFRARLLDNPPVAPVLDPLIPAIVRAVTHWGAGGRPVAIVHDRQKTLSDGRIAQLREACGTPKPALAGRPPGGRLASLRLVDSRSDARVQVADVLAGVARKLASDALNDRGDARLTALLRTYVDPSSTWADDRSWSLLEPTSGSQPIFDAAARAVHLWPDDGHGVR